MSPNTFDEVLGLEEEFYDGGFQQGLSDGIKAGRIEGRTFGLEKGFEKYVESGRMYGKVLVWANQMHSGRKVSAQGAAVQETSTPSTIPRGSDQNEPAPTSLPPLPNNQRLAKHIKVLHALSESESLSTENTEEAVTNFDDRLKRAQGKTKVIERIVGDMKGETEDIV
ncbi:uncharacterized protein PAC_09640 [Phialocephala subalpina]|uniref:Essential protein Yae1 N-terminal domain-containing protein n=1 Tax=Phialocephala subalpina TaxID=576137 RepID=A0A1L7X405_9HELO|nr:uncharacterized protein PAC_09640 [Phialocephala subalpina]